MAQPVRKKIQETHADAVKETPIYTLLVDGNSLLFSCFADDKINGEGVHYGGVYQFLLQLRILMQKKDFDYICIYHQPIIVTGPYLKRRSLSFPRVFY